MADKKLIPKHQSPWQPIILQNDNTSILRPMIILPIKRDFIAEALRRHSAEAISLDNRTSDLRKRDNKEADYKHQQYQKAKDDLKRAEGLLNLMTLLSPSTYAETATGEQFTPGERFAIDVAAFGLPGIIKRGITSLTKQVPKIGLVRGISGEINNGIKDQTLLLDDIKKRILEKYNPYTYNKPKLPEFNFPQFNSELSKIDFSNIIKDDFTDWLSLKVGKSLTRKPITDTPHGGIYKQGFSFVDNEGKEIAYIAGNKKGNNVWVESSYVDPEYRYQGLGKQMYFDFNDNVFSKYGTTLHSSPYLRLGSTGAGMSPSNRLWKSLVDNKLSTIEGSGLDKYNVMAKPSQITTMYRYSEIPTVSDILYFSQQPVVRAVPEHTAIGNPLQTRLTRLLDHANYGTDVADQAILVKPVIRGNEIRSVAKQLEPNLTDSDLDLIGQIVYANRRGAHIPIESGKRVSGISVVDILEAINYLKESGIKNPNTYDVGIIAGHEAGHGVQVSPRAKQLVLDFVEPEEFYTRAGQILDDAGVFETSQNPVSFGKFMQFIDDYLKRGNLDNGISALKLYMLNISSPIKRLLVMGAINRFSVGTGSAYLLNNSLNE